MRSMHHGVDAGICWLALRLKLPVARSAITTTAPWTSPALVAQSRPILPIS